MLYRPRAENEQISQEIDDEMIWMLVGISSRKDLIDLSDAEKHARSLVAGLKFDIFDLYKTLLDPLDDGGTIFNSYDRWDPDEFEDTIINGGSDCFGLAAVLKGLLTELNLKPEFIALDTNGLPAAESAEVTNDIGSVALMYRIGDTLYILEPGFGLTKPLIISSDSPTATVQCDGRTFTINVDFSILKGILTVESSRHKTKTIGVRLDPLDSSVIDQLQKDYVRIRPTIHCDRFDIDGNKIAGIKLQLLHDRISICLGDEKFAINFDEWSTYDVTELANLLEVDADELNDSVIKIIRRAGQIRALWTESLKRQYFENTGKAVLNSEERGWSELRQEGYVGGGVVSFVSNGKGQILLYKVPKSREKAHIGRFSGQLNSMVETAGNDEDFEDNLKRGLEEELGIIENIEIINYRETDYGKPLANGNKILARCCVVKWDGDVSTITFNNQQEGGQWDWYDIDTVLGYEIEPNIRPILEKYILEGLL